MMTKAKAHEIVEAIIKLRDSATDEQAAEVPVLYPEWREDVEFEAGKRVRHGDKMYRVKNKHRGHRDHMPENDGEYFERINGNNEHRPRPHAEE